MEKINLNNQVVLMRKYVKQAKVHFINKLVKEVKLLQNRKGNEDQVLKAKRKAERFLEEISLVKKMKPDSISKLALSRDKNWKDVLLMKNCPIEERCVAMLANYGPVQKEVEIFLNSNKNIASKITILFKEMEEKSRLNKDSFQKKKPIFSNLKNKTITHSKNLDKSQENIDEMINESDVLCNDSKRDEPSIDIIQNVPIDDNYKLKTIKNAVKQKKNQKSKIVFKNDLNQLKERDLEDKPKFLINNKESENESNYEKDSQLIKNDSDRRETPEAKNNDVMSADELESEEESIIENDFEACNAETKSLNESSEDNLSNKHEESVLKHLLSLKVDSAIKSRDNKVKAIAVLNLDDLKDLEEIPLDDNSNNDGSCEENQTDDESTEDESPNDPFFLGRDETVSVENKLVDDPKSKMYRSVDKIFNRKEKSFDPSSFENKSQRPMKKPMNRSQLRQSLRDGTLSKDDFLLKKDQQNGNKFAQIKSQNRNKFGFEKNNSKGRFHPYNQYKDEKDFKKKSVSNQNEYKKSKNTYQRNETKNSPSINKNHRKEADLKPLHPSWEAKRKQKESINTSFQGKRMVFKD